MDEVIPDATDDDLKEAIASFKMSSAALAKGAKAKGDRLERNRKRTGRNAQVNFWVMPQMRDDVRRVIAESGMGRSEFFEEMWIAHTHGRRGNGKDR